VTARILVVVPCYNEEDRLDCSAFRAFAERNTDCGFLFVNDGSTDNTGELLRELCRSNSAFLLHELPRNCGKAEAVRQGMLKAMEFKPAYIGMWDADLAAP